MDEFTKSVIETCEKYDFKDLFILNILEKAWWGHVIVESKNEYENTPRSENEWRCRQNDG